MKGHTARVTSQVTIAPAPKFWPELQLRLLGLNESSSSGSRQNAQLQSQQRPSLISPPRLKIPVYYDPVKSWNFRKADWSYSFLLTRESIERLPTTETTLRRHTRNYTTSLLFVAKQSIPRGCWVSPRTMCHVGIKSVKPFFAPSFKPQ